MGCGCGNKKGAADVNTYRVVVNGRMPPEYRSVSQKAAEAVADKFKGAASVVILAPGEPNPA